MSTNGLVELKSCYLSLLVVFSILHFGFESRGENQTNYQISVNGLLPKIGEETEKTWDVNGSVKSIIYSHETPFITNMVVSESLKFRDKILNWDETNEYALIQIKIENWFFGDNRETNQVLKPGTEFTGRFVDGKWFFDSPYKFPEHVNWVFKRLYIVDPRNAATASSDLGDELLLDKPRSVGESWNIGYHPNHDFLKLFESVFSRPYQRLLFDEIVTNKFDREAQLVGITNVYGCTCFNLEMNAKGKKQGPGTRFSIATKEDMVLPMNELQCFWSIKHSYYVQFAADISIGENTKTIHKIHESILRNDSLTCRKIDQ